MQSKPRSLRSRRGIIWLLDHPWLAFVPLIGIGVFLWIQSTRTQPYHVQVEMPSAFNLVAGLPVDVDGIQAGMIDGVHYVNKGANGAAVVDIGISSAQFRPLHVGTTVTSRWGSTIGNGTRRLDINPGSSTNPAIPDNGIIPEKNSTAAVDLDQVLNVLTTKRRAAMTGLVKTMKSAFANEASNISSTLTSAPGAFNAADDVLSDLAANTYALRGLITNGDRLTATLADNAPQIQTLVSGAGQTFETLATHAQGIDASLEDAPPALTSARQTLVQLDGSVSILTGLVKDIKPGAKALIPLADDLDPTFTDLRELVPNADATLTQATKAAPAITSLLSTGTPLIKMVGADSSDLSPMVACIRPYAPELGDGIESAAEWMDNYTPMKPNALPGVTQTGPVDPNNPSEVDQHGVRAMPEVSAAADHADVGISTAAFVKIAGKDYAFPRPPGESVGQPWYLPQCGAGPNSTNPADDPENPVK